jgi:hypothetical protein
VLGRVGVRVRKGVRCGAELGGRRRSLVLLDLLYIPCKSGLYWCGLQWGVVLRMGRGHDCKLRLLTRPLDCNARGMSEASCEHWHLKHLLRVWTTLRAALSIQGPE